MTTSVSLKLVEESGNILQSVISKQPSLLVPIELWVARQHITLLRFRHPKFELQLADISLFHPPLSPTSLPISLLSYHNKEKQHCIVITLSSRQHLLTGKQVMYGGLFSSSTVLVELYCIVFVEQLCLKLSFMFPLCCVTM